MQVRTSLATLNDVTPFFNKPKAMRPYETPNFFSLVYAKYARKFVASFLQVAKLFPRFLFDK